ncbi:hypothetical protein [Streptomyces sp. NPDC057702]|uniref:hypothetical protein n=1 Tax=unclassified Streptomyces TaxID=2593676 RepID=UPI00368E2D73
MVTLAVTGHINLTGATVPLVREGLRRVVDAHVRDGLTGVSCIAAGADALFAELVLAAGGRLVAIVPSRDYREAAVTPEYAETFDRLRRTAHETLVMPYDRANRTAYAAANAVLLERADRLVAVWDGTPPTGKGGGTADVVTAARDMGLPVDVVWPAGARRG